ncbi:MFS transporter [Alloscardovia macacae]|uniref:MFS transporter n=1 Tax=Alloscardovia macacae TaxID=1160091 RepID=A0A261F6K7_9BIFI|nr:MFS transporter [Alloscardovia macacae]OZG54705.1 MFS transporter [Alloscardovia macacae]
MISSVSSASMKHALHTASYIAWFTADTASQASATLHSLAISLLTFTLTQSTVSAGWVGTASLLAQLCTGVFGGTFVDRHDRKILLFTNSLLNTFGWGLLCILLVIGKLDFTILLIFCVGLSAVQGFLSPAADALLKSVIPLEDYAYARSITEGRNAFLSLSGAPLSSILFTAAAWLPFFASTCLSALSSIATPFIRPHARSNGHTREHPQTTSHSDFPQSRISHSSPSSRSSFLTDFSEGWTWTFHHSTLVRIIVAMSIVNFSINGIQYTIQLHLLSTGASAISIGIISAGIASTMLLGSVLSARMSSFLHTGKAVCSSLIALPLLASALLLSAHFIPTLAVNSLLGLPIPLMNALLLGFIFAKAPDTMQGRLATTLTIPAQALSALCGAVAGSLLPILGYRMTLVTFSVPLILSALLCLCSAQIRRIPRAELWASTSL